MKKIIIILILLCSSVTMISCGRKPVSTPAYAVFPTEDEPTEIPKETTIAETTPVTQKQYAKYIVLTPVNEDYDKFYVYVDKIVAICPYSEKNKFYPGAVVYAEGNFSFHTKESVEEILQMIDALK